MPPTSPTPLINDGGNLPRPPHAPRAMPAAPAAPPATAPSSPSTHTTSTAAAAAAVAAASAGAAASSPRPAPPPRAPSSYPPAEPTVLGGRTGEVRRMRSVLELRLGPLASSLDKCELLASQMGGSPGSSTPPKERRGPAASGGPLRVEYDMFGIEIPQPPPAGARAAVTVVAGRSPSDLDLSALLC
jgi:hypothetical protein